MNESSRRHPGSSRLLVEQTPALPADFTAELLPAALEEGFTPLLWLQRDWETGANRFALAGEALYTARIDGRLAGVGGLNRDPYAPFPAGRLRRLYVLPRFRRLGVGRRLVQRIAEDAARHFGVLHLRTFDPQAGAFYLALGFEAVSGQEAFTHRLVLGEKGSGSGRAATKKG